MVCDLKSLRSICILMSLSLVISACGGGGGGGSPTPTPVPDVTPDAFTFTAATGALLSTAVTSNAITVAGIDNSAPISITDGEYRIGMGDFTATAGTVDNGQSVEVRRTSSNTVSTDVSTTLTIGGVTSTFTITTLADATAPTATIAFPPPASMTEGATVTVRGTATDDASGVTSVMINGIAATATGPNGSFDTWSVSVPLADGETSTLTVVATDAAANENSSAASVTVKRDTAMGDFPDSVNPLSFPVSIALDADRNRLLVGDRDLDAILTVDIATGARGVLSDPMTPDANNLLNAPEGLLVDSANNRVWVGDLTIDAVFEVSLVDGTRMIKSSDSIPDTNNPFNSPREMVFDPNDANRLLIADQSFGITAMDITTGERAVFSSGRSDRGPVPDDVNDFRVVRGVLVDSANQRLFALDSTRDALYSVNPSTGAREIFSNDTVPNSDTPVFDAPRTLILDQERNRLLVNDDGDLVKGLIEVDLATGVRSIFSNPSTPNTINAFMQSEEVFYDGSLGYVFVADSVLDAILAVDIVSGERVFISRGDTPGDEPPP